MAKAKEKSLTGIKNGDKVSIDYEGKLVSGEVFDSSKHGDHSHPLEFEVGSGMIIPGFEKQIIGMKKGEEKEFSLEAEDAYGERNDLMIQEIPLSVLPEGQKPQAGMVLMIASPDGRQFPARIVSVNDETMKVDLNHPLAGKKLIFKIKILEIN